MAQASRQTNSDADNVARFLSGDASGFEALVRRYAKPLFNFIRRYLGDDEASKDVFQETMMTALKSIDRFDSSRPVMPWLVGIAVNRCREEFRRRLRPDAQERTADPPDPGPGPDAMAENSEEAARIAAAVAALDESHRAVFLLRIFEGFTYSQIGEVLNISEGTAKSRMHHAVYTVRKSIRRSGEI